MIIAIDFDGTIVSHQFPEIGEPIPGAFEALRKLKLLGHQLILWTCRSDADPMLNRPVLSEAVLFCQDHGVIFDAINCNLPPYDALPSRKIYADLYIDDRSFPILDAELIWRLILISLHSENSLLRNTSTL